jgi:hypothetical protein
VSPSAPLNVTPTTSLPAFVRYASPGVIALDVPEDWVTAVETADLWLFAEAAGAVSMNGAAEGPALMVHRLTAADPSATTDDPPAPLRDVLSAYLARMPLGEGYQAVGSEEPIALGELDALEVTIENGGDVPGGGQISPARRVVVTLIRGSDGATYAVAAMAETADWDRRWPVLEAMRASLEVSPGEP